MDKLKIEYYGHACFRLTYGGQRIVLDPYADGNVPGLKKLRTEAEFVYCSHDHDDAGGTLRGKNIIRLFTFGKLRVAHFGDLGRELTSAEAKKLSGLDCVMLPVGGYFTIDGLTAKKVTDAIGPEAVIPMHYRSETAGYDVLGTVDDFFTAFDGDRPDILPLTVGGWVELEK